MTEVRYIDIPVGAQQSATVTATGGQPFSAAAEIASGVPDASYATLEAAGWPLDGKRLLLPDEPSSIGWWTAETAAADGSVDGSITLTLPEPITVTGLTFTFSPGGVPTSVHLSWYQGQTLLAEGDYAPDSEQWVLTKKVEAFDTLVLSDLHGTPGNFVKIDRIQYGEVVTFGDNELISVQLYNEIDPSLCELTEDTLSIELLDLHGREYAPQEKQEMQLLRDGVMLGRMYIRQSTRVSANRYTFDCASAVSLLTDQITGGIIPAGATLETVLPGIMGDVSYDISQELMDVPVSGYLPICTRREALQMVAFAAGAMVTTAPVHGQGANAPAVRLLPLPTDTVTAIPDDSIFPGAQQETTPRVYAVSVVAHSYTTGTETETLINGDVLDGAGIVYTFNEPHHSYSITGGTLTAYGDNYAVITAHGAVTLTGKTYIHATQTVTRYNAAASAAERGNTVTVDTATTVTQANVGAVADRLAAYYLLRQKLTESIVVGAQRCGTITVSQNPWAAMTRGYIRSMDSALTRSGWTGEVVIIGTAVERPGVYSYAGELYAGDKEVLY